MSESPQTFNQAVLIAIDKYAALTCFKIKPDGAPYQDISYRRFAEQTFRLAYFFQQQGVKPGDRVALIAANSPEWMMAYLACLLVGGVAVPLRATQPTNMLRAMLRDSGAVLVLLDQPEQLKVTENITQTCPNLKTILTLHDFRSSHPETTPIFIPLAAPLTLEDKVTIRLKAQQIEPQALASIYYTASEAGRPKGAMFNQGRRLQTMQQMASWLALNDDDLAFTVIPWSSSTSLDFSLRCFLSGVANALAKSGHSVFENFQETSPTFTLVTPFGLESFYNELMSDIERLPKATQEVFRWALAIGKAYQAAGDAAAETLREEYAKADMTFFNQIRGKIGGRITRLYSVGAPLPQKLVDFAEAIGIIPLNVYNYTLAGGYPAVSQLQARRPGTCGKIAPGFEVTVADDGEILIKSPTMMLGYWQQHGSPPEIIDAEGWLHTGDVGRIDEDGYLCLMGRKETIIILSSGRRVDPARIEDALEESPFVAQAVVFGDGRRYVSALIVPDLETLADSFEGSSAKAEKDSALPEAASVQWYWQGDDDQGEPIATVAHPDVKAKLDKVIETVNSKLDLWEQIRKYSLLDQAYSRVAKELADLTPLRRREINQRYAVQIDAMYPKTVQLSGERVTEVEVSPERMRELLEKENILDAWMADAGIEFLFELAHRKQIDAPSIVHICDTAAGIAQMENEERPLSTALIVGDPVRINRVLPTSQIQLLRHEHIRRMRKNLVALAMMVDGLILGYTIDKHGYVRGIHKLDTGDLDAKSPNRLLGPQFRRHASISGKCDALVFFVPSGGKQVRVFAEGQLVGRYSNGDWSPESMPRIDRIIARLVEHKRYNLALIERILSCAFKMSEENLGAIFIIGDAEAILEKADAPEISHFAWILGAEIANLSDQELINFAKQDGATVIDHQGLFRGCMVLLRPDSNTKAEIGPGKGARHSSAAKMSAETQCLAITVSQDGPITIYDNGQRLLSL